MFFLNFFGRGLLASGDFGDLTLLLFDGFDALTFQGEDRFLGFDVLFLQRLFFVTRVTWFSLTFSARGQLGDLLDTLGIENVVRREQLDRGLLQVIDRRVIETVTVEVGADDLQDFVFEFVSFIVQLDKVKLLSDGLQCFGELGIEKFAERVHFGTAFGSDRCRDFFHLFFTAIDANEEGDFDVRSDVVFTDQTPRCLDD